MKKEKEKMIINQIKLYSKKSGVLNEVILAENAALESRSFGRPR